MELESKQTGPKQLPIKLNSIHPLPPPCTLESVEVAWQQQQQRRQENWKCKRQLLATVGQPVVSTRLPRYSLYGWAFSLVNNSFQNRCSLLLIP